MRHCGVVIVLCCCVFLMLCCALEAAALEIHGEFQQTMMAAINGVYDSSIQRIIRSDKGEWTSTQTAQKPVSSKQIQQGSFNASARGLVRRL